MHNDIATYQATGYEAYSAAQLFGVGSELHDGTPTQEGYYRMASAEELFGAHSFVVEMPTPLPRRPLLGSEPLFQSLVVVTFIVYLYMLVRSWHFIGRIWSGVFRPANEHRMANEGGTLPLARFKATSALLGVLTIALAVVRIIDMITNSSAMLYTASISHYMPLVTLAAVVTVMAWSYLLHTIIRWVTLSDTISSLAAIGYMNLVRSVVVIYPVAAVWLLSPAAWDGATITILAVLVLPMTLIYLKDIFMFFVAKNISILHCILYLCTAILLPVSFLVAILPDKLG